jgi:hypothetical protein
MVRRFFNYIFSLTFLQLFLISLGLSIFLTASFFYLFIEYPGLLYDLDEMRKADKSDFRLSYLTLLGKFYMISGIFPNFLFLILIFRLIKFLFIECLKLIGKILSIIFSDKNLDRFNEYVSKLEKSLIKNKPKIDKVVNKIKLKKKIKKDYLMPLSIIIAATILAIAILLQ